MTAFVTCLVLLLAKNPHVIGQMSRELAENDLPLDDAEGINVTSLAKLTYFDYVIREVLRLYPPIGGGYRRVIKSFELQVRNRYEIRHVKVCIPVYQWGASKESY